MRPLFARVLVKREKFEKSKGGIIIPQDQHKNQAKAEGRVIAVGPTADKSIQVGQLISFGNYAGAWQALPDGSEVYCLQDEDALCVIEEAPKDEGAGQVTPWPIGRPLPPVRTPSWEALERLRNGPERAAE